MRPDANLDNLSNERRREIEAAYRIERRGPQCLPFALLQRMATDPTAADPAFAGHLATCDRCRTLRERFAAVRPDVVDAEPPRRRLTWVLAAGALATAAVLGVLFMVPPPLRTEVQVRSTHPSTRSADGPDATDRRFEVVVVVNRPGFVSLVALDAAGHLSLLKVNDQGAYVAAVEKELTLAYRVQAESAVGLSSRRTHLMILASTRELSIETLTAAIPDRLTPLGTEESILPALEALGRQLEARLACKVHVAAIP